MLSYYLKWEFVGFFQPKHTLQINIDKSPGYRDQSLY